MACTLLIIKYVAFIAGLQELGKKNNNPSDITVNVEKLLFEMHFNDKQFKMHWNWCTSEVHYKILTVNRVCITSVIYRGAQKNLLTVFFMIDNYWRTVLICDDVFLNLYIYLHILNLYKFCTSYTVLHKEFRYFFRQLMVITFQSVFQMCYALSKLFN